MRLCQNNSNVETLEARQIFVFVVRTLPGDATLSEREVLDTGVSRRSRRTSVVHSSSKTSAGVVQYVLPTFLITICPR